MVSNNNAPVKVPVRRRKRRRWPAVAVIILVLATAGYFGWNYFSTPKRAVKLLSGNSILLDTLPDGSIITLNSRSRLTYPQKLQGSEREVTLDGEAFFKVANNPSKPFIINAGDVSIKVNGTTFNVMNRNGLTEVMVDEGTVTVSKGSNTTTLRAGDKLQAAKGGTKFYKQHLTSKLYGYYATNELVCKRTPLKDLVQALRGNFGEDIVIENPAIADLPVTATFKNKTLDQILISIIDTFNIQADYKGSQIILK